ncbi:hypothetical protein [Streptomyces sp. NPDC018693]|uniref:hypothetical protein n=1 Tax=unclassified Streptomyces TaxID=2593676 RepID=UPI003792361F
MVMESGSAIFAGTVFGAFGSGLLLWTGAQVRRRQAVAYGARPALSAAVATAFGIAALMLAGWCLGQL